MAYVICEPCVEVKDRACIEVCPVDCIHPTEDEDKGEDLCHIDPDTCIDCGACEPVCPVEAIFEEEEVPEQWQAYIAKNAEFYQ